MATVQEQIEALVDELRESENLSPARVEAVEMTLTHLAALGQWPPMDVEPVPLPEKSASTDGAATAARVVEALRLHHVKVTGPVHQAIAVAVKG